MSDGFSEMIAAANEFFGELAQNNTREWFEPRKGLYKTEIRKPAELMAELFAEDISRLTGKAHGSKVFRINRDVRFSKDKSPYNAHLHILWRQTADIVTPGWFFGSSPDYLIMGMGIMDLRGEALVRYRAMVDKRGDDLTDGIAAASDGAGAAISDWGPEPLKRVPKPYAEDHPHAGLLKRKSLTLSAPFRTGWQDKGVIATLNATAKAFLPLWRVLDEGMR